jgi:tetratricopeptide (TPR) repeat protein
MTVLGRAALLATLVAASACAPKTAPTSVAGPPKFPDFVNPTTGTKVPARLAEALAGGWAQLQAGNVSAADRAFTRALRDAPSSPPVLAALGYVALARNDADRAVARFDAARKADTAFAPALAGRGEALLQLNRPAEALESFEAALAADPALPLSTRIATLRFRVIDDSIAEARRQAAAGDFEAARRSYEAALEVSPDSAVLFRELAAVERKAGRAVEADAHLGRAIELDPSDRASRVLLGQTREEIGDYDGAIAAYEAALAIEPSKEIDTALVRLRERADLAKLPEQFQTLADRPEATRADLAAAVAIRVPGLLARAPVRPTPVLTDVRGTWARPWILATVRAGVLDAYPNHTFQPAGTVRRADLAAAASRVLALLAAQGDRRAAEWQSASSPFTDLSSDHPAYRAAAVAVAAGVLTAPDGAFRPGALVSGRELVDAVARLQRLAGPLAGRVAQ